MTIVDEIERDYNNYRNMRADRSLSHHAIELAEATLARLDGDLALALDDGAQTDAILHYIEHEQANIDERDEPLCTCELASCPLKRSRLPYAVRDADSIAEGIMDFRKEHSGTPTVLLEARDEIRDRLERVRHHVSTAHAILVAGGEMRGVPEDADLDDEFPLPAGVDSAEDLIGKDVERNQVRDRGRA